VGREEVHEGWRSKRYATVMKKRSRHTKKHRTSRTPSRRVMDALDRALEDSFPASDPVSLIEPATRNEPHTREQERKPKRGA
jgi:hypothetical protein